MIEPILLPPMTGAQAASWHALMDLHERFPDYWTLVGGQMVHLHCAEQGVSPERPTEDADTVLDVRAAHDMLAQFTPASSQTWASPRTPRAKGYNTAGGARLTAPRSTSCCQTA